LFVAMLVRDISLPVTVFGLPLHAYRIVAMLLCHAILLLYHAMLLPCHTYLCYYYAMC
jgi:hypothetical protein